MNRHQKTVELRNKIAEIEKEISGIHYVSIGFEYFGYEADNKAKFEHESALREKIVSLKSELDLLVYSPIERLEDHIYALEQTLKAQEETAERMKNRRFGAQRFVYAVEKTKSEIAEMKQQLAEMKAN